MMRNFPGQRIKQVGTHMAVAVGKQQEERVAGRVWTVRLDPYGRPSAGTV